ncbi:MAG: GNAT family N-acetyltransferase [Bacteroidales bacterium]
MNNFERLIQLAEEVFDVRNDPDQLGIDEQVMERLQQIHPCTMMEEDYGEGPVAWVLVIPTTLALMHEFLEGHITERRMFYMTPVDTSYEALYLCSALVLEEYRRKGIVKKLVLRAIEEIRRDHPLKALFVWSFSEEGEKAANSIARSTALPLYQRIKKGN